MRRMLREKFEYDKIDNFPAYMLDYVVNGERGDLEEREIDAFEDWMDRNGYVSISTVPDEEWSEDFCSHPAFGPACDCVPVYAERGETGDRSGKSRMNRKSADLSWEEIEKLASELIRINYGWLRNLKVVDSFVTDEATPVTPGKGTQFALVEYDEVGGGQSIPRKEIVAFSDLDGNMRRFVNGRGFGFGAGVDDVWKELKKSPYSGVEKNSGYDLENWQTRDFDISKFRGVH